MTKYRYALLGIPALLLAACGGGSTGGSDPQTSAPPPPPKTNTSLTNLTVSQTFNTASATIQGQLDIFSQTPSSVGSEQSDIGSAVRLSYDADADKYTINVNEAGIRDSETFGPGQVSVEDSSTELAAYTREVGDEDQLFALFKPGNPTKSLTYVTYGIWQRLNDSSTSQTKVSFSQTVFIAGIQTETSDMPSTGTASYSATVEGFWTNPLTFNALAGTADLTADFTASSVEGSFDLIGQDLNGNVHPFDILTGDAHISGNAFSGIIAGETTDFTGNWGGGFFGPDAQEIGGTFRVTDGNEQAVGVFVGN